MYVSARPLAWRFFVFYATHNERTCPILNMNNRGLNTPHDVKALVEQSLSADKASDIVTIDLDEQTGIADYMIIATGTSSRHVSALAEKLRDRLQGRGLKNVRVEGLTASDWVVLDAGDVVVHLFRDEVRAFYNIEKMWGAFRSPAHPASRAYA